MKESVMDRNTYALFEFIKERHSVAVKKQAGEPKPWTDDPILQKYRFCNVYRELDAVTLWITKNWRDPNARDNRLWFAMVVARLLNLPDTLADLGYPDIKVGTRREFDTWGNHFIKVVEQRQTLKKQVYNGAYTISTNGVKMVKHYYLLDRVFRPAWEQHPYIVAQLSKGVTLAALHSDLSSINGLGSFMAAQVVADLKYANPHLKKAKDWWTWAASGPGSRRGLNRVCGFDKDKNWREVEWLETLDILYDRISGMAAGAALPRIHAQDLQNCLCEFDKYERVRLGEGRPRSLYPGLSEEE